jgi:hypothetical protein
MESPSPRVTEFAVTHFLPDARVKGSIEEWRRHAQGAFNGLLGRVNIKRVSEIWEQWRLYEVPGAWLAPPWP